MEDLPAIVFVSGQGFAFVLPANFRRGFSEDSGRWMAFRPTVSKPNPAIAVVAPDGEDLRCLPAAGSDDRHELIPRPSEQTQACTADADFQHARIVGARAKNPIPQARPRLEHRPMLGRVCNDARKHDLERRVAERDRLVQRALHLRAPDGSPGPGNEGNRHKETHPYRGPKPFLPEQGIAYESLKKRIVPDFLKQRMAPEFCNQRSKPGKGLRIHQERAVTQPKIARATALVISIMPAGMNFFVFRNRTLNKTTSTREITVAMK